MPVVRRTLLALATLLAAVALAAPAEAAGTTSVTATATIAGDSTTSLAGTAWFYPAPFTSAGGSPLVGGSLTRDVNDGDYVLGIQLTAMDGQTRYYKEGVPAGVTDRTAATVVTLSGTPFAYSVEFPQLAKVGGTVTNGDGQPMAGMTVFRNRLGVQNATVTAADGSYSFGYVREGNITVSVNGSGSWAGARSSVTVPASGTLTVDLVMPAGATIAGTLTDADTGDPLAFVDVYAYSLATGSPAYVTGTRTGADGHFSVGGLPDGGIVLQYSDALGDHPTTWNGGAASWNLATPLTTTPGATLTHDEALASPADPRLGRQLSGTVTDSGGSPVPDIDVTVRGLDGSVVTVANTDRAGRWGADPGNGQYTLQMSEGFVVRAAEPDPTPWFPEYFPDGWAVGDADVVTVADDQTVNLDVALERAAVLDFGVRDSAGSTSVDAGYRVVDATTGATVFTDPAAPGDGNLLDIPLRPGSWKVLVSGQIPGTAPVPLVSQWYGGGVSLTTAPALAVTAGQQVHGATLVLPKRLGWLTAPKVKGRPAVGRTLTATRGTCTLMTGTTFAFTWLRGTKVVGHAASYVVKRADAGQTLKVKVKATNGTLSRTKTLKVSIP